MGERYSLSTGIYGAVFVEGFDKEVYQNGLRSHVERKMKKEWNCNEQIS